VKDVRERRRSPRYRCRLPCGIRHGAERDDGTLLDVSLSGLLVQTTLELTQGDPVDLEINGQLKVTALAWHSRRARRGREAMNVVGMMLSEVGPDYERFVGGLEQRRAAAAPPRPAPEPPAASTACAAEEAPSPEPVRRAPPPLPQRLTWWRLRVKAKDAPRTRIVTLAAASRDEAIERSLAEMGEGWEILDAQTTAAGSH
jgi:PilZ domain